MSDSFKIEGLSEFQNKLANTLRNNQRKYDELRLKIGKQLLKNAAKQVASDRMVETGRLLSSFQMEPYTDKKGTHEEWKLKLIGKDVIEAGSTVWYARLIEEGHILTKVNRTKNENGKVRRNKKILGFVPGKHYFAKAMEKTYSELPELTEDFLKELGKEAGFDVTN
jgi:hypothetical protein